MAALKNHFGRGYRFTFFDSRKIKVCLTFMLFLIAPALRAAEELPTNAGTAIRLDGSEFVKTTWIGDAFYSFTFELWFSASRAGVLITETHKDDSAHWDYAFAELLPSGVVRVGVPGLAAFDAGSVPFGSWHHLALVYDHSEAMFRAYLDGSPTGVASGTRLMPDAWHYIYSIGRGGPKNLGPGSFLAGQFDEVRLWSRALPQSEVMFQYNKIIAANDVQLRYYWRFDELVAGKPYLSPGLMESHEAVHVPATSLQLIGSGAPVVADPRPFVASLSTLSIASGAVEFGGVVNPRGLETAVHFEYGRGSEFPHRTETTRIGSATEPITFHHLERGLPTPQGYNYRLVASNAFGVTISGEKTFATVGWAGYAYDFTFSLLGPGSFLRTVKSQNDLFPDKNITVDLWFNAAYPGTLITETDFTVAYEKIVIELLFTEHFEDPFEVRAGFNGLDSMILGRVDRGTWNHVALRYNATTLTMDGFLNGSKTGTATGVRVTPKEAGVGGQFVFGGKSQTGTQRAYSFLGSMDELRVWNTARTDQDLTAARFNLLAGDEPGLVLNWRGEPSVGDRIPDVSLRGNDGQRVDANLISSTAPLVFNIRPQGEQGVETQFAVKAGTRYRVESSSDLATWTGVATNTAPATGYVRTPSEKGAGAARFFRVVED